MQIPTGWTALHLDGYEHATTALLHTPEFTLQITHQTRETTLFQVREAGSPDGFEFQNRQHIIEFGWHRSPAEAFRFAEAYLSIDEPSIPAAGRRLSQRYSRAVDVAYATR